MSDCKLCGSELTRSNYLIDSDLLAIECSNCGRYMIDECLVNDLNLPKYQLSLYKVASWIREKNDDIEKNGTNNYPVINSEKFDEIINSKEKTIQEKLDLLIIYLANNKIKKNETNIVFKENQISIIQSKCWMSSDEELVLIFQEVFDQEFVNGRIKKAAMFGLQIEYSGLTFKGKKYVESLEQPNKSSKKIFVAFNFEDELISVFDKYVRDAVEELGFIYTVVNQDNSGHDKAISDEIIAKLKSCKILIADFTNQRNSVYFESGFAMGMKIPIIWTCQEGHTENLSFDTRQYPHLVWKDGEDLKQQIMNRIKVIV